MMRLLCAILSGSILVSTPIYAGTLPAPDAPLPFKHVTLYTSGVGYFERSGLVSGNVTDTLYFPVSQINDVLKSLVLLDTGGSIQPVTYAAKDPIDKQLQAFTIDVSDNPDRSMLLNRIRGANVTVMVQPADATGPAYPVTGQVVGVESQVEAMPDDSAQVESLTTRKNSSLNILAADGLHSIAFEQIVTVKIDDPALDAELREALITVGEGRDSNKRPVKLSFHGNGTRTVQVGYVSEAPVWQSTYRLVLGKASVPQLSILQGWALVQNTSQDDWNGIDLTLVSGKPVSFIQDLYTPLYVQRPVIQSQLAEALAPVSYNADMNQPEPTHAAPLAVADMPSQPMAAPVPTDQSEVATATVSSASPIGSVNFTNVTDGRPSNVIFMRAASGSVGSTGAKLGEALFTYNISVPVTIRRQQSAMIPFTSSPVTASRVAIYNHDVNADHPMTGARIKNTSKLHLLGGPITVFDEGATTSYVGDAIMDDTQPNQTRLISFALDSPVDAAVDSGDGYVKTLGVKIVKGVMTTLTKEKSTTIYKFKNHGADDQTIVVEYPDQGSDWHVTEPATPAEHTATVYRYDLPVAHGAAAKLSVVAYRVDAEDVQLVDEGIDDILTYISQSGPIEPEVKAKLREVATRKQAIGVTQAKIANVTQKAAEISNSQQRIRENMKVLDHTSQLFARYSGELDVQETKLNDLNDQLNALNNQLAHQRNSLSNFLANLTIGDLPSPPRPSGTPP